MKTSQTSISNLLRKAAQILFFPFLLLVIGWQKIFSLMGFSESSAMDEFIKPVMIIILCVGLPLAVTVAAWAYVLLVANKNKKTANTRQQMIVSDRARVVTWIIKNFVGWIYVIEGEQVGIVGSKIYPKSGLFFEWLGTLKRISILSYQDYHTDISVKAITREETQVKVDIIVEYSARKEHASELLKLKADPVAIMKKTLEALLVKIIQAYYYDALTAQQSDVEIDIKLKFEKELKYYNFNVSGLRIDGDRPILRSAISMESDRRTDAFIKQQEALIAGEAEVKIYDAKKQVDSDWRRKELNNVKSEFLGNTSQQPKEQISGAAPGSRQIGAGAFDQELKRIVANSSMKFIKDSVPYQIAYNGHGIQLSLDEAKGSVNMEIWNSKMQITSTKQPLNTSLQALLSIACERIDKEAAKRTND